MSFESSDTGVNQVLAVRPDDRGRSGPSDSTWLLGGADGLAEPNAAR
jgi:hypothetical protein